MQKNIKKIIDIFEAKYPDPESALNYNNEFELLVATILSAQTTDKQVNKVTSNLFDKYNSPDDFASLEPEELEEEIKSIGLYRNKSKYIVKTSKKLIEDYKGQVPDTRKQLTDLSGVGRKTANVVLSCGFTKDAFPVDTHVFRLANRIGLVKSDKVREVEEGLMEVIPKEYWSKMHHWLIFHGREVCKSQNPRCEECKIKNFCNYYQNNF
ncbi:MAG TPA: endonuclease III [Halanaerobiales bacterium]|nr:endonuclease III [Halanaerobiales bacterium]